MKKFSLIIFCLILPIMLTIGCNSSKNSIKKLNVDFEKYVLLCNSGDVCQEINNNIIQYIEYESKIENNYYKELILTSDGNLYVYNSSSGLLKKLNNNNIKIDYIDKNFESTVNIYNDLICSNKNCYSIETNGDIRKIIFEFDFDYIIDFNKEDAFVVQDGKLAIFASCEYYSDKVSQSVCKDKNSWFKVTPKKNDFLDMDVSYANPQIVITKDNKVYSNENLMYTWDYNSLDLSSRFVDVSGNYILQNSFIGNWFWDFDSLKRGNILLQNKDYKLFHHWGDGFLDEKFTEISFNEKVDNIFFLNTPYVYLIVGVDNVFIADYDFRSEVYNIVKLDRLNKFKNDIRSIKLTDEKEIVVLLSDGNFYKVYDYRNQKAL